MNAVLNVKMGFYVAKFFACKNFIITSLIIMIFLHLANQKVHTLTPIKLATVAWKMIINVDLTLKS